MKRDGGGVLFVFLDGVGIGKDDEGGNPFVRAWARAVVPTLQELVGGTPPTLTAPRTRGTRGHAFPLDATLGVQGTPQSGTGQAALLTGVNAAEAYGRHFGPWTPVRLRPLVEEQSVLRVARGNGHRVVFANAYPRGWPGSQRHLGHTSLPDVTPEEAGANLGRIAAQADLTLYAHYSTDTVGHRGTMDEAIDALETVDGFLAGILAELPADHSLLVASDHGNIEDMSAGHTLNPALGIAAGPAADRWANELESILDVGPAILRHLGSPRSMPTPGQRNDELR
jgi:hypothetical protein